MQPKNVRPQRENNLKIIETNFSIMIEFVLLGFSDIPQFHWFLFGVFLVIYIIILLRNGIIILITRVDSTLQTSMYFFPQQFFLPRNLLCICHNSKNAHGPLDSERSYLFLFLPVLHKYAPNLCWEPLSVPFWQ